MTFPDDLPEIIYYRLRYAILTTFPRRPVQYVGTSGDTDANEIHPQIPYGCIGWRLNPTGPWLELKDLPPHWMPFLERKRPSEMDPRPAPKRG